MKPMITFSDFEKMDLRVGTILSAVVFEKAKKPAYILEIDFGALGLKKTSAQITKNYNPAILIGKQVVAVVNFPKKQIANIQSQCLVLGSLGIDKGDVVLLTTNTQVENGSKVA